MVAILQITDAHIVPKGALACRHSDTATALRAAVATINARRAALGPVDCVLVSGDLTDNGTAEEYAHFIEIMGDLALPYLCIPGNHDRREEMRNAFAGHPWMPAKGPIHWVRDIGPFTLIALDTLRDGAHDGEVCADGLGFLDQALADCAGKPVLVATHHPWMPSGIAAMDGSNLRNGDQVLEMLNAYLGPVRMTSGHVHRAMTAQIGRVTCQIAPAPGHSVHLDTRPGAVNSLTLEPGGITHWHWIDGAGLVSGTIPVGTFEGPWPFA